MLAGTRSVWLDPIALASNRGFRSHELTRTRQLIEQHREFFLESGMPVLVETSEALAVDISCSDDALTVVLDDGRSVSVPLEWFPRLAAATSRQRKAWEPIGGGIGIHWEAIDEDISVASLLQPERFMRLNESALASTPARTRARRRLASPLAHVAAERD